MKQFLAVLSLALVCLSCNGQQKKESKSIDCETLVSKQLDTLWKQSAYIEDTFMTPEEGVKYELTYNFDKSEITVLKNAKPYLKIDFIHLGRIDVNSESMTWFWEDYKSESSDLKIVRKFGKENNCEKLIKDNWPCEEKDGWRMIAMANMVLNTKGGARHYTKTEYNFVAFKTIKTIN